MIDRYISDTFLQTLSQIFLVGTFVWMIYPAIVKRKILITISIFYWLLSVCVNGNIYVDIFVTMIFFGLILKLSERRYFVFLINCFIGFFLINYIVLYIHVHQETLFYMMLKLTMTDIYLFIYMIYMWIKNKEVLSRLFIYQIFIFIICMCSQLLIVINNQQMVKSSREILYFPVFVISLLYVIVSILLYHFVKQQKLQEYFKMQELKNELKNKQYHSLKSKYEDMSILKHDIKNHLQTILILTKQNQYDLLNEYLETYLKDINEYSMFFKSSHLMLEIIINEKFNEAQKHNIHFYINYKECDLSFIEDMDIVTLFSNLLDNAIEANRELENDRYINIDILHKKNYLYLNFKNPFTNSIIYNNELLLSTKNNHLGMGLTSVKRVVEKYQGILNIKNENQMFNITIMIPFKQ